MNTDQDHGNIGNKNAAKPKKEKLSETRTFRFKPDELKAYNRAKHKDEPLRIWVRRILNAEAGMPPPDAGD